MGSAQLHQNLHNSFEQVLHRLIIVIKMIKDGIC